MEEWRQFLYPLGFLAALCFGARFLLQWLYSEWKKRSIVPPLFWRISLLGNLLLLTHSLIQLQFHVAIMQAINATISWRNLNLLGRRDHCCSTRSTCLRLLASMLFVTLFFFLHSIWFHESFSWFRIPRASWQSDDYTPIQQGWHLFGFVGLSLFSVRFWLQWWQSERHHDSVVDRSFWWLSLIGASITLIYFARIRDLVNLIGPICGLIPFIRNLLLMKKNNETLCGT